MCGAGGKVLEQSTDWRCDANQHQDDWRHSEGDSLGVPGSQAFWRDLAEDQNQAGAGYEPHEARRQARHHGQSSH